MQPLLQTVHGWNQTKTQRPFQRTPQTSWQPTTVSTEHLQMITLLTTAHLSHYSSLNLIETVNEKLEKHTSSREVISALEPLGMNKEDEM